ncbi:950_t:CDS:1 [Ambispora gerdemannii]|uniref:950_t:CDS:1 n=1 Tax=Ambispora gerdemannii TaxID=144530 RepID=A0A9N9GGN1_9GLOM|nr:950_t:CDS:1 [Ambispora gerdemannii]
MENQTINTPYLKTYYHRGSTFLTSEQIETIRTLKGKVPKYKIIGDFNINEHRVDDIWENRERKQQMIYSRSTRAQSTISSDILPKNSNQIGTTTPAYAKREILYLESTTFSDKEIKKKSSKSQSKSARITDLISSSSSILVNNENPTEKISGSSRNDNVPIDIIDQIERENKR